MRPATAARVLLMVAIISSLAVIQVRKSPRAKPATAPAAEFSAERAREVVAAIAREPHPIGSAANTRVREELVRRLRELGLEPQVQTTTVASMTRSGRLLAGTVNNVMARWPGRTRDKAVLLVAHYDSVPTGPGVSDDGTGVAALLEALRALKSGEPLARDLILLLTDGEEAGLLGARAFVEQHPWASEVGVVLNFEARGTHGPVLMFETSSGNGRLIDTLSRAVGHPIASSYSQEVYKRMPNDTDFTIFRNAGYTGLNFAHIHNESAYHTAQDSLERLSLDTLQHHGEYALALARAFGNEPAATPAAADAVYFNPIGSWFVHYPGGFVLPLAVVLALATLIVVGTGLRRGRVRLGPMLLASLLVLMASGLVAYLMALVQPLLFESRYNFRLWGGGTSSLSLTMLVASLLALALAVVLGRVGTRLLGGESWAAGGLLVWLALAVAISLTAPGASALLVWPLAAALPAVWVWYRKEDGPQAFSGTDLLLSALAIVVAAMLWASTLALLGVALDAGAAPVVAGVLMLLLLGLLGATLHRTRPSSGGWVLPLGLVLTAVAVLVAVRTGSRFGNDNLSPDSLLYLLDTETGTAQWVSLDRELDPWTSGALGESPERGTLPTYLGRPIATFQRAATAMPVSGPQVVWEPRAGEGKARRSVKLAWSMPFERALLVVPASHPLVALNGRPCPPPPGEDSEPQLVVYSGVPAEGLELELEGEGAIEFEVVAQRYGFSLLPALVPGLTEVPRPSGFMALPTPLTDSILVRSVIRSPPSSPALGGPPLP